MLRSGSKTVAYLLGRIHRKFSLAGRRELRNLVEQDRSFTR
ncbi:hypothetical protein [Streptomyces cadmiisoli]